MRLFLFFCLYLFSSVSLAKNSWVFVDGTDSVCGTAIVMNDDNSFFLISCGYNGARCALMMLSYDSCNGTIPSIVNFSNGFFAGARATCSQVNGVNSVLLDTDNTSLVFESIFSAENVSVALPTKNGKFISYSYSLDGSKSAANQLKNKCFASGETNRPF